MIYKIDCPTPANTPKNAPQVFRVKVYPGVTKQTWIGFPPGPKGLCHLQVYHWGWQVWPWSPADSFHWDDYVFTFHDSYKLTTEPLEFVVKTWSFDDTYLHTPFFAVHVEPDTSMRGVVDLDQVLADLGIGEGG